MATFTKTQQIEKQLRECISNGRWPLGGRLPSEEEMRIELRVSQTTLRSALQSLASDGVISRKHGSGTYVTRLPRTGTIAVLVATDSLTSMMGYWYGDLVREARKRIEEAGYRAVISVGSGDTNEELISCMSILDKHNIKDVVGVLGLTNLQPFERLISEADIHSVFMDGYVPAGSRYAVLLDYRRLLELGADMLKAYGHPDFAFMCFDYTASLQHKSDVELDDYVCWLRRNTLKLPDDRFVWVPHSFSADNAYTVFKDWWARSERPKAIYFDDDSIFDVASRAILELGISVPEELAIISLAHVGRQFHFPISIAGVGYDPTKVVSVAWDMLQKLITGQAVDEPVVYIKPELRGGDSLG